MASNSFIWRECDSVEEALCSAAAPRGDGECPERAEAILTSTKLLQECEMCDLVLVHETLTLLETKNLGERKMKSDINLNQHSENSCWALYVAIVLINIKIYFSLFEESYFY